MGYNTKEEILLNSSKTSLEESLGLTAGTANAFIAYYEC